MSFADRAQRWWPGLRRRPSIRAAFRTFAIYSSILLGTCVGCESGPWLCLDSWDHDFVNESGESIQITPFFRGRDGDPHLLVVHGLSRGHFVIEEGATRTILMETGDYPFDGLVVEGAHSGKRVIEFAEEGYRNPTVVGPLVELPAPDEQLDRLSSWLGVHAGGFLLLWVPLAISAIFGLLSGVATETKTQVRSRRARRAEAEAGLLELTGEREAGALSESVDQGALSSCDERCRGD